MKWLLENIEITLLKVIRDNDISYDDSSLAGLSEDSTLENYKQTALELCEKNKQPENDNQLIVRIQAYIDEKYGDPSLCLSRISDLFHISESYFSFLFKKTVGVNFSTYLEQVRMTQAKHLLETTNIKIADLYVAVGYNKSDQLPPRIQEKVRCSTQSPSRIAPYSFSVAFSRSTSSNCSMGTGLE